MESTDFSDVSKKKKPPSMTPSPSASAVVDSVLQYMESVSVSEPASGTDSSIQSSAVPVASSAGEIIDRLAAPTAPSSGAGIEQSSELVTASASQPSTSGHIRVQNDEATVNVPGQTALRYAEERETEGDDASDQGVALEGYFDNSDSMAQATAPARSQPHDSNHAVPSASGATLSNAESSEPRLSRSQRKKQSRAAGTPRCPILVEYAGRSFGTCGKYHLSGAHDQAIEAVSKTVRQQHDQYRSDNGCEASEEIHNHFSDVARRSLGLPLRARASQPTQATVSSRSNTSAGARQRQNRSRSPAAERPQYRTRTPLRATRPGRGRPRCQHCGRYHRDECWTCALCSGRGHTARGCPNAAVPASTSPTSDHNYLSTQTFHQMLNTIPDAAQLSAQAIDFHSAAPAQSLENYTPSVDGAPYFLALNMVRNIFASIDSTIHHNAPPQHLPQQQPLTLQAAQVGSTPVSVTPVVFSHESTQHDPQTGSPSDPMVDDANPPQEPSP